MAHVEILLDPDSSAHEELEKGTREILDGLTSVKYWEQKKPAPVGKLVPGWEHVTSFLIQNPKDAITLGSALISAVGNLLRWASPKEKKDKTIVIVIDGKKLELPASNASEKRFLRSLQSGESEEGSRKKPKQSRGAKPSAKKRGKKPE